MRPRDFELGYFIRDKLMMFKIADDTGFVALSLLNDWIKTSALLISLFDFI